MSTLQLTWTLAKSGQTLQVAYTVRNTGEQAVYLLDQLRVLDDKGTAVAPQAIVVAEAAAGQPLQLTRGWVPPEKDVLVNVLPAARLLDAGASVSGSATIDLPLTAWHPRDGALPLKTKPTHAVLRLGYLPGDAAIVEQASTDGSKVSVPKPEELARQAFIVSAPQPIP